MSFTSRLKNHPTIQMFRLLVGLEPYKSYQISSTKKPFSRLLGHPFVLLLMLIASLLLLVIVFTIKTGDSSQVTSSVVAKSVVDPLEKRTLNSVVIPDTLIDNQKIAEENNLLTTTIRKTKENTVQFNSKRIEKLEMLLIKEQKKNKELYNKLNTQDSKLQELQAIALKDVKITLNDQKYITAISENKNATKLDEDKISKIDYYNKVRVLLSSELDNKVSRSKQSAQLQSLINELYNDSKSSKVTNLNNNYKRSLAQESLTRSNEVRSIVLKKNETLWGLAKRAYGDGMLYKKIIQANPHINEENVWFLEPGILIRIPK